MASSIDRGGHRLSAAVCRRELRRRLIRRRVGARNEDGSIRFPNRGVAAAALNWSRAKQDFLETGEQHLLTKDLSRVFEVFEIPTAEQDEWAWLANGATAPGWWDRYGEADLSAIDPIFMGYEWGCRRLQSYTGGILYGLVQTREYGAARIRSGLVQRSSQQITRMNEIREQRKAVLGGADPLDFHLIFDESVLHRDAGPGVMAAQIAYMLELVESHPNVTLQVMPYSSGIYPALAGSFTLMDFGFDGDDGLVNLEPGLADSIYVEDTQQLYLYSQMFENMAEARAASPEESIDMLRRAHARSPR
jgi:hypothetical protein